MESNFEPTMSNFLDDSFSGMFGGRRGRGGRGGRKRIRRAMVAPTVVVAAPIEQVSSPAAVVVTEQVSNPVAATAAVASTAQAVSTEGTPKVEMSTTEIQK